MSGEVQFYLVAIPAVVLFGLSKGGFSGLGALGDADDVARRLAGQGGRDRPADPHGAGLGQRLGVPPRLFAAQPRHPDPVLGDRRRARLAARRARQRGRGASRDRRDLDPVRRLHADPRPARGARRSRGRASRRGPVGLAGGLHQLRQPCRGAAVPGLCDAAVSEAARIRRHGDDVFAAVNLLKVPPYFLLGQFSRDNLVVSAWLLPVAILSTFAGVWLVRRVSADRFYAIILALTFLIGVKLTYDAVRALA